MIIGMQRKLEVFCDKTLFAGNRRWIYCAIYLVCFMSTTLPPWGFFPPSGQKSWGKGMPQEGVKAVVLWCCCLRWQRIWWYSHFRRYVVTWGCHLRLSGPVWNCAPLWANCIYGCSTFRGGRNVVRVSDGSCVATTYRLLLSVALMFCACSSSVYSSLSYSCRGPWRLASVYSGLGSYST